MKQALIRRSSYILKIDRSFIRDLANNDDRANVAAIVAMGKAVAVKIITEGVETQEQLDYLRSQVCDEAQGFLFQQAAAGRGTGDAVRQPGRPGRSGLAWRGRG